VGRADVVVGDGVGEVMVWTTEVAGAEDWLPPQPATNANSSTTPASVRIEPPHPIAEV
jgi:hypothetical protein